MLVFAAHEASRSGWFALSNQRTDFRVFYCGGAAVNRRADPYRVEPVRTCEHSLPAAPFYSVPESVLPVALPGFDLAPFSLLARLPFTTAAVVWTALQLTALAASVVLLAATLGSPVPLIVATLVLSDGIASVVQGQLIVFEILALAGAAFALVRERQFLAGLLTTLTLIELHVGLPICLVVFVLVPRARASLALGLTLFLVASVTVTGPAITWEYVTRVAPQQIVAELSYQEQYSLSYLLRFLGLNESTSAVFGKLSYVLAALLAIVVARGLEERHKMTAAAVFVPAAFSIMGGPYVHVTQTAAAIPLALSLWAVARSHLGHAWIVAATALIAVAWPYPYESKPLFLGTGVALAVIFWYGTHGRFIQTLTATLLPMLVLWFLENRPRVVNQPMILPRLPGSELATSAWHSQTALLETHDPAYFAVKILTWAGLLILAASACWYATSFGSDTRRNASRERLRRT